MAIALHVVALVLVLAAPAPARSGTAAGDSNASQPGLPATLPLRREGASGREHSGWTGALLVLSMAGTGAAWAGWRRRARRRPSVDTSVGQRIVRVSSQALTPHASLHAVQWNGEELLLACTAQEVTVVARHRCVPPSGSAP